MRHKIAAAALLDALLAGTVAGLTVSPAEAQTLDRYGGAATAPYAAPMAGPGGYPAPAYATQQAPATSPYAPGPDAQTAYAPAAYGQPVAAPYYGQVSAAAPRSRSGVDRRVAYAPSYPAAAADGLRTLSWPGKDPAPQVRSAVASGYGASGYGASGYGASGYGAPVYAAPPSAYTPPSAYAQARPYAAIPAAVPNPYGTARAYGAPSPSGATAFPTQMAYAARPAAPYAPGPPLGATLPTSGGVQPRPTVLREVPLGQAAAPPAMSTQAQGYGFAPPPASSRLAAPTSIYSDAPAAAYAPAAPAPAAPAALAYAPAAAAQPEGADLSPAARAAQLGPPNPNATARLYSVHRDYGLTPDPAPIPPQFFANTADLSTPETPDVPTRATSSTAAGATAAKAAQNGARLASGAAE